MHATTWYQTPHQPQLRIALHLLPLNLASKHTKAKQKHFTTTLISHRGIFMNLRSSSDLDGVEPVFLQQLASPKLRTSETWVKLPTGPCCER